MKPEITDFDLRQEQDKFARLCSQMDDLIRWAEKAKQMADEMHDNIKSLRLAREQVEALDPNDPNDVEWEAEFKDNLARAEDNLLEPITGSPWGSGQRQKFGLSTMLSFINDHASTEGFESKLLELAKEAEFGIKKKD